MKNIRKYVSVIITVILLAFVTSIGIYNIINNKKFFDASITALLTIVIAIIFSYWFTQIKSDKRKRSEKIDSMLYKIQSIISDPGFLSVETDEICRKNLIAHRSVGNKITYLKKICEDGSDVKVKVLELETEFGRFREFYGDHYCDKEYMKKSEKELLNYVTKIDDKADEIHTLIL